jgi:hypothetical protein
MDRVDDENARYRPSVLRAGSEPSAISVCDTGSPGPRRPSPSGSRFITTTLLNSVDPSMAANATMRPSPEITGRVASSPTAVPSAVTSSRVIRSVSSSAANTAGRYIGGCARPDRVSSRSPRSADVQ